MPSGGEIRIPGRQGPDAMQVIGQNNHGLDGKWSASAGRLEHLPKLVNVFWKEFPAAFQQRDREEDVPPGTKARIYCGISWGLPNCLRRDAFLFPALHEKMGTGKFTQYLSNKNRPLRTHCYICKIIQL
jgi:hypothetical protein